MNIQVIIILLLFIGAIFYVVRMIVHSLSAKKGCGSNCKCGVDFSGVEAGKTNK
jgi:hypothetical protein